MSCNYSPNGQHPVGWSADVDGLALALFVAGILLCAGAFDKD